MKFTFNTLAEYKQFVATNPEDAEAFSDVEYVGGKFVVHVDLETPAVPLKVSDYVVLQEEPPAVTYRVGGQTFDPKIDPPTDPVVAQVVRDLEEEAAMAPIEAEYLAVVEAPRNRKLGDGETTILWEVMSRGPLMDRLAILITKAQTVKAIRDQVCREISVAGNVPVSAILLALNNRRAAKGMSAVILKSADRTYATDGLNRLPVDQPAPQEQPEEPQPTAPPEPPEKQVILGYTSHQLVTKVQSAKLGCTNHQPNANSTRQISLEESCLRWMCQVKSVLGRTFDRDVLPTNYFYADNVPVFTDGQAEAIDRGIAICEAVLGTQEFGVLLAALATGEKYIPKSHTYRVVARKEYEQFMLCEWPASEDAR